MGAEAHTDAQCLAQAKAVGSNPTSPSTAISNVADTWVSFQISLLISFADRRERPPGGVLDSPAGTFKTEVSMPDQKLTPRQRELLRRRGLNPDNYVLVRALYSTLYLKDIRTGRIKIITKNN